MNHTKMSHLCYREYTEAETTAQHSMARVPPVDRIHLDWPAISCQICQAETKTELLHLMKGTDQPYSST